MDDREEAGVRRRQKIKWVGLGFAVLFGVPVALGFAAAHLERNAGDGQSSRMLINGGAIALLLIATIAALFKETRPSKNAGQGERNEARIRRTFWAWMIAGGALGFVMLMTVRIAVPRGSLFSSSELPAMVAIGLALLWLVFGGVGTAVWLRQVDELEKQDDLWSKSVATTAALLTYPSWYLLGRGGLVMQPSDEALFGLLMVTYTVAYFWRKARR